MRSELPPEMEFVTRAVQPEPDVERLDVLCGQDLDWDGVYRNAVGRHKVGPLLYRNLRSTRMLEEVPDSFSDRLREHSRQTATRNLTFVDSLLEILDRLEEAGIAALPYKGPVLSEQVFGDVSMRQCRDLDILVRPGDLFDAVSVLLEEGFEQKNDLTETERGLIQKNGRQLTLVREGVIVELHPRVSAAPDNPFTVSELMDRQASVSVSGQELPAIDIEDHVILLCIHGTRHRWTQLKWLSDIAYLIEEARCNWSMIVGTARKRGGIRRLLLGCELASSALNLDLPTEILQFESNKSEKLVDSTYPSCFNKTRSNSISDIRYSIYSKDGATDMIQYVLWALFVPTVSDSRIIDLPSRFQSLYYILHPAFVVLRRSIAAMYSIRNKITNT